MLTRYTERKLIKKFSLNNFSLILFFYFTRTNRHELEKLKTIFQEYNLKLMRFKGLQFRNTFTYFPDLFKNANFVAWNTQACTQSNLILLTQLLNLKVIPLAFFYQGQIWTVSRLKKASAGFFQPMPDFHSKTQSFSFFWNNSYKIFF